jgi:hypothetical protein
MDDGWKNIPAFTNAQAGAGQLSYLINQTGAVTSAGTILVTLMLR